MLQLTYISTARDIAAGDLEAILAASRRNNRRDAVTGLLLFNGKRFLQALEGPPTAVEAAYQRIKVDPRHRAPVILSSQQVDGRQFGDWDMAFDRAGCSGDAASLVETVDTLVANVADRNVRALFASYVRLRDAA